MGPWQCGGWGGRGKGPGVPEAPRPSPAAAPRGRSPLDGTMLLRDAAAARRAHAQLCYFLALRPWTQRRRPCLSVPPFKTGPVIVSTAQGHFETSDALIHMKCLKPRLGHLTAQPPLAGTASALAPVPRWAARSASPSLMPAIVPQPRTCVLALGFFKTQPTGETSAPFNLSPDLHLTVCQAGDVVLKGSVSWLCLRREPRLH